MHTFVIYIELYPCLVSVESVLALGECKMNIYTITHVGLHT